MGIFFNFGFNEYFEDSNGKPLFEGLKVTVEDRVGTLTHISEENAMVVFDDYDYSNEAYPYHNINPKRVLRKG